jgi:hypothetical protein
VASGWLVEFGADDAIAMAASFRPMSVRQVVVGSPDKDLRYQRRRAAGTELSHRR